MITNDQGSSQSVGLEGEGGEMPPLPGLDRSRQHGRSTVYILSQRFAISFEGASQCRVLVSECYTACQRDVCHLPRCACSCQQYHWSMVSAGYVSQVHTAQAWLIAAHEGRGTCRNLY